MATHIWEKYEVTTTTETHYSVYTSTMKNYNSSTDWYASTYYNTHKNKELYAKYDMDASTHVPIVLNPMGITLGEITWSKWANYAGRPLSFYGSDTDNTLIFAVEWNSSINILSYLRVRVNKKESTTNNRGSYIGEVRAYAYGAYPQDGIHTDGYWYVYVGATGITGIKGSKAVVGGVWKDLTGDGYVYIDGVWKPVVNSYVSMNGVWKSLNGMMDIYDLPEGYTQVEYIQSSGTQYIDTGHYATQNTKVTADAENLDITTSEAPMVCGSYVDGANQYAVFYLSNKWNAWFGSSTVTISESYAGRKSFSLSSSAFLVDSSGVTISNNTFANTRSLYLFAMNHSTYDSAFYYASMKLYGLQIYESEVLIRDFVPCMNPSGEVGLYDTVSKMFYSNAGTGAFIAGKLVNSTFYPLPGDFTSAEYIQSSGTQWVDTGFTPNQDTRIDISAMAFSNDDAGAGKGFIPYGAGVNYNLNAFECYSSGGQLEFNYANEKVYVCDAITNSIYNISHNKNIVSITGAASGSYTFPYTNITPPYTMTLFAIHRANTLISDSMRLYSCQIYDNGTLIRDFIPCANANGEAGLWDKVNGVFYGNSGTGEFTAG